MKLYLAFKDMRTHTDPDHDDEVAELQGMVRDLWEENEAYREAELVEQTACASEWSERAQILGRPQY